MGDLHIRILMEVQTLKLAHKEYIRMVSHSFFDSLFPGGMVTILPVLILRKIKILSSASIWTSSSALKNLWMSRMKAKSTTRSKKYITPKPLTYLIMKLDSAVMKSQWTSSWTRCTNKTNRKFSPTWLHGTVNCRASRYGAVKKEKALL